MTQGWPTLEGDRYDIVEMVGHGAASTVYRAIDRQANHAVAIKVMHPEQMQLEAVRRWAQEAEILGSLNHPGIVRVHDTGVCRERSNPYMVMDWIDGETLRERVSRGASFEPARVASIVSQIADAVAAAAERGVVHRDLKPENVLLCAPSFEVVKVVDFGMAKIAERNAPQLTTDTSKIFGTPQYMSPERARGDDVGAPADVYALGIIAYELLEGRRPFEGATPVAILVQHLNAAVPRMLHASSRVEEVILAALAKAPECRPDATMFGRRLADALID
ncbi:MAG: serine/threonine protein kinase [Deltaproteobacteria bacterium]|nr:serine/threonine protein kinase [Deltaproteobacteria bacterium]